VSVLVIKMNLRRGSGVRCT